MKCAKLIVYIDGSYCNYKGGWSCIFLHNHGVLPKTEIYASCKAFDSGQIEMLACIKAIVNLPNLFSLSLIPNEIEFRSDYLFLVNFINKYNDGLPFEMLFKNSPRNLNLEFMEVYHLLQSSQYRIKAKKVNKRDGWLNRVDKHAKYALNNLSMDASFFYRIKEGDNKDKLTDMHKYIPQKLRNPPQKKLKWIQPYMLEEIVYIPTKLIRITEDIHLKTKNVALAGKLKVYQLKGYIDTPIAIRPLYDGTYSLVAGISRLCIAKLLGFENVPVFICDLEHKEFMQQYSKTTSYVF